MSVATTVPRADSPFSKLRPEIKITDRSYLHFDLTNAKLPENTAAFSLPAGYTCPGACDCLAWFDRDEGRLYEGKKTEMRCFAASLEAAFKSVRRSVELNLGLLQRAGTTAKMADLIYDSLPSRRFDTIRIHADGDFYHKDYFLAWIEAARRSPERLFYAYTKSLPIWIKWKKSVPENLVLTASYGGKWDNLIKPNKLRSAKVVNHPDDAAELGLEIDHDDSHAMSKDGKSFALLLHGQQRSGSAAAAATKRMRDEGIKYSYSKTNK